MDYLTHACLNYALSNGYFEGYAFWLSLALLMIFFLLVLKELTLFYSYSFCLNLNQNLDKDVMVMDTHASNKRTRKHRKQQ